MSKIPRVEQETVILYSQEEDKWEIYSNVPKHIRRWRDAIGQVNREEFYKDGTEKMIDGQISGSVSIRKPRKLTEEQKKEVAERLKVARQAQSSI